MISVRWDILQHIRENTCINIIVTTTNPSSSVLGRYIAGPDKVHVVAFLSCVVCVHCCRYIVSMVLL